MNAENATTHLIRWAGVIILALIFSLTGYHAAENFLFTENGCEREVRKIAETCYRETAVGDDEADALCTKTAENMIASCHGG